MASQSKGEPPWKVVKREEASVVCLCDVTLCRRCTNMILESVPFKLKMSAAAAAVSLAATNLNVHNCTTELFIEADA